MQRRARQKLLECTDLGRTEKEFVLNWNSAVHADPIHSDAYTAQACSRFAKEHAEVRRAPRPQTLTVSCRQSLCVSKQRSGDRAAAILHDVHVVLHDFGCAFCKAAKCCRTAHYRNASWHGLKLQRV